MLPFLLLAAAGLASAHFQLEYPYWRADSLNNDSYSQYEYPCAGVPSGNNRTAWPTRGSGSLELHLHHAWSYLFISVGLGDNVTNFNYTLTPGLWNITGKGTLCVSDLALPAGLTPTDGQVGSLQVVTVSNTGAALYNCADITFRANATAFGGANCTSTDGITIHAVGDRTNATSSSSSASSSSSSATTTTKSAGTMPSVSFAALSVVGAAVLLCLA